MEKRMGFMQLSFAWIFALIVGAFILFLSIYIAIKFSGIEEKKQDVVVSKELGILLNPLESGFEQARTAKIELQKKTRIQNRCEKEEPFGRQVISVSEETFGKWSANGSEAGFLNKYIFSDKLLEGNNFYLFSMQFEFPFKIADLIVMTSADKIYCFVDAPEEVQEKIRGLKLDNVLNKSAGSQCPHGSKKVCFSGNCDITINKNLGKVTKRNEDSVEFYGDALMYSAIFSDNEIYECQFKRLMQRTKQLASLYNQKATFINRYGCSTNLPLASLINLADNFENSRDLSGALLGVVDEIKTRNEENQACRLW
ncbi:hypothetical protein HYT23_00225 [Candidatus Pacearchaeota archaeon]|nr:hypothetical protein [Candidatus Pacearchaeota archaeon]